MKRVRGYPRLFSILILVIATSGLHCAPKTVWEITRPDGTIEKVALDAKSCEVIGWKEDLSINFILSVAEKFKREAGFKWSREELRKLDELTTDFGTQSRSLCVDWQQGVYKGREALYDCRKANIGKALAKARELKLVLESVNSVEDAAAKGDAVRTLLDEYFKNSAGAFRGDCDSRRLRVSDKLLEISAAKSIDAFRVINVGFFPLTWWIENFPKRGFYAALRGDNPFPTRLSKGSTLPPKEIAEVEVIGTREPIDPGEYRFDIAADNGEREQVRIKLLQKDSYQRLESELRKAVLTSQADLTPLHVVAFRIVDKYAPTLEEGTKWFMTGQLLFHMKEQLHTRSGRPIVPPPPWYKASLEAFNAARRISPRQTENPAFQYFLGLAQSKAEEYQAAIETFKKLAEFSDYKAVASTSIVIIRVEEAEVQRWKEKERGEEREICFEREKNIVTCNQVPLPIAEEIATYAKNFDREQLEREKPGVLADLEDIYGAATLKRSLALAGEAGEAPQRRKTGGSGRNDKKTMQ